VYDVPIIKVIELTTTLEVIDKLWQMSRLSNEHGRASVLVANGMHGSDKPLALHLWRNLNLVIVPKVILYELFLGVEKEA